MSRPPSGALASRTERAPRHSSATAFGVPAATGSQQIEDRLGLFAAKLIVQR